MRHRDHRLAVTILVTSILLTATPALADTVTAWDALWSNRVADSEVMFQDALDHDDHDPSAWRGLLLSQVLLGFDDRLARSIKEYAKRTEGEPSDGYLAATVDALCGLDSRRHYKSLYEYSKRLAKKDRLSAVERRIFLDQRARYALLGDNPDDCRKLARDLGRVTGWAVLGPFDNTSGSGHDRMHLENWDFHVGDYTGKFGQQIRWRTPAIVGVEGVIRASNYFHESEETTAYLRSVIEVPRSGRYLLAILHEGDLDLWVDGVLVFEGSRKTAGQAGTHFDLQLDEGDHLIAARLSNRADTSSLAVGISEIDGDRVEVRAQPRARFTVPTAVDLDLQPVHPAFEAELASRSAAALSGSGDREAVFWALRQALDTEEPDSIVSLCEQIETRYPDVAVLGVACGLAYDMIGEANAAIRVLERAGEQDSTLVMPRLYAAQEDLRKKRHDAAIRTCDEVLTSAPSCIWALSLKLDALLARQDLEAVERLARRLVHDLPDEPQGYSYLAAWAERRGMKGEMRSYQKQAMRRQPPLTEYMGRLFQRLESDDYEEVKDISEELLEYMPDVSWLWSQQVESQVASGNFEDAMEILDEALASFPQDIALLYYKSLFAESGAYTQFDADKGEKYAAGLIDMALNIDPSNLTLRDKSRTLQGLTPYREYLPDPELSATLARRVAPEDYPGERAVVLLESKRRLFFDEDVSLLDYYVATQVLTKAGVEAWEKFTIATSVAGRVMLDYMTVKPDGTEHQATIYLNEVHFENLEPGDVVVVHYQSTQFQGGQLKGHTWDKHRFAFVDHCLESTYEMIVRAGFEVSIKLHNGTGSINPVVMTQEDLADGFELRRWTQRDIEGTSYEANATNYHSYQTWLDVSTVPSWQVIATWYSDIASGQAADTRAVRTKAEELCAGVDDPDEKVERIFRFVAQDVNYASLPFYMSAHVPREAEEVLDSRFGDCKDKSCLMIALLESVGIDDARFALIDVWGSRVVQPLPSPRFNHAIVCRPDGQGGYHWYDPTIKYGTSRQIPGSLAGGFALIAAPMTRGLTTITVAPVTDHPSRVDSEVMLAANGSARIRRRTEDSSVDETADLRGALENLMPHEIRESLQENIAVRNPGAVLDTFSVTGSANVDSLLIYDYRYEVPHLLQDSGTFLVGSIPWAGRLSSELSRMIAKAERRTPIDLHRLRSCEVESLTVILPDGYEIVEVPVSRELGYGDSRYRTSFEYTGNQLRASSEIVFAGDRVPPADYPEFKQFLEAVLQDQRTPLLIKKSG